MLVATDDDPVVRDLGFLSSSGLGGPFIVFHVLE